MTFPRWPRTKRKAIDGSRRFRQRIMIGTAASVLRPATWRVTDVNRIGARVKERVSVLLRRSAGRGAARSDQAPETDEFLSLSYVDSLRAYFAFKGVELSKALLMGLSGEAFKFFYDRARPARSIWVFLNNPLRATCNSLGYRHTISFHETIDDAIAALEEIHARDEAAILQFGTDYPVVYPGLRIWLPDGERHVTQGELRKLWTPEEGFLELGLYGYYLFTVGEQEREPKPKELYLGAFRRALKIARAERRVRGCFIGLQAYDGMIAALRAKRDYARVTPAELVRIAEWNTLPALLLVESRRAAIAFLEGAYDVFEEEDEREALDETIRYYRRVVVALEEVRERHPTTRPEVGSKYVLPADVDRLTTRDYRRFFAACRRASRSLERAQDAEYKATQAMRRIVNISEKTRM